MITFRHIIISHSTPCKISGFTTYFCNNQSTSNLAPHSTKKQRQLRHRNANIRTSDLNKNITANKLVAEIILSNSCLDCEYESDTREVYLCPSDSSFAF